MAALMGGVKGSRGQVTRLGGKGSGMHVWAKTWGRRISVRLAADGSYTITVTNLGTGHVEHGMTDGPEGTHEWSAR